MNKINKLTIYYALSLLSVLLIGFGLGNLCAEMMRSSPSPPATQAVQSGGYLLKFENGRFALYQKDEGGEYQFASFIDYINYHKVEQGILQQLTHGVEFVNYEEVARMIEEISS